MGLAIDLGVVLDALSAMVWTALPDGRIDFVNRSWLEYTGHDWNQPQGWHWKDAVSADDLSAWLERWAAILVTGKPGDMMVRVRRFDGRCRLFVIRANPIRDPDGEIVRWCAVANDIEELQCARQALKRRALDFQLIVDSISVPVAVTTPTGEVEGLNQLTLDYFGKSLEVLKDWKSDEVVHPEDLAATIAAQTDAHVKGVAYNVESRHRRADGVYRWYNVRGFPLRDRQGGILRWFHLLIDIDEKKRAEEVLRVSERNLNEIINAIPAQVWSARLDGSAEYFNQYYLDYVGCEVSETRDWGWTAAVHPDDLHDLSGTWQSVLARGSQGEAQARLRRHDGQYRWFLFRVSPMRDGNGNIVKWYGINTDIDDRKRAEEELQRSEAFLAEGQRLTKMGNFSWRVATGNIVWSEQIYRMFELESGRRVRSGFVASRIHPDDRGAVLDIIERARRGERDLECQHRLMMPDQSVKYVHMIAHRSTDHPDNLEYIGAALDITQRRLAGEAFDKARSELVRVARIMSLGALTASIAHEVNQPLSGIVTNASTCLRMLGTEPPNMEGARETARRTIRDGNRAADVIGRLRTLFSKRSATIEAVDLNDAAREVIALLQSDLDRARVILRTEFAGSLPCIGGDRVQVQQVIMNLLRNAADAMSSVDDRPRCVLIRTESESDAAVRLTVRDSGVGFDPRDAERLFDTFYTTRNDGMGIGLAISRSIIESHRGRLWATLPKDGPGASFAFSIPAYGEF
ncbi:MULTISPECIES: PAS domain S-box protein [Burkholderiaceae]|uniref:PAS domain S-box protein n=1 Tax=Burkholderiaceae TaxID=119060 RepID=UPI0014215C5F|nr:MULTISPECIES: PAS domain S-box protein [Burkholderiaceae]MBN3846800.1 PAS domain S-box protein [Paraburkholderia sp. Ac-20342]NIF51193.1 PAS domain S-box protein [Burkholderia sp. Ax-1724]NIF76019.1 PAS domain S-box protein [Paraburkholderia sp. Cy-641]